MAFISFFDDDYHKGFDRDHNNPIVITAIVHNYIVKRVHIDLRSLTNILYSVATTSMNIQKKDLQPYSRNLIGFFSKIIFVKGAIKLRVTLGT